ncbi:MAG: hypothetical protein K6C68_02385 [Ruminococcus sp.]|nr:hypothetical protein [Ruminococcus sp.]
MGLNVLAEQTGMQNIFTPLTATAHMVFCIIATIVYMLQFYRRGSWHYLLLMLAVDLTFLTQTPVCRGQSSVAILGAVEAVILIAAFIVYLPYSKKLKAETAAADAETDKENERQKQAELAEAEKDSKPVDNAFEE